ncbi:MAG: polyprenyl synthetase family protein [Planctomycetota bacterium]|nr:MAG: polyprenyl synthetase family protein [Planctomycetota bacterium]
MPAVAPLYECIADDLKKVCQIVEHELFSDLPAINELCSYVRQYQGKMLRPALLLLSAEACGGITNEHLTLAAVVEMVHMATLVHDDVLDEAEMRRRCPTINCLQGNEAAILLGDYLISHAFYLCNSIDSQFASRKIGATTNILCEGELQQLYHRGDSGLSVEQYIKIITHKTAFMIGTCCLLGAHYSSADDQTKASLEQYGLDVGVAFQMTDDVLDIIGSEERMGKTLGRDLEKKKPTLPVIHCLAEADEELCNELKEVLSKTPFDRERVHKLLESTDSINYSLTIARRYVDSAIECLAGIPVSEARDTLDRMARLIVEREQ